ncbi:MAG: hypothetical protein L6Q92_02335 [Phycisphaerae bacterium]|nr:hypothetical protein [Phycisphaerae bacterium]
MPESFELGGRTFRRVKVFKHDFFAATGLYDGLDGRVILKLGRTARVFGLPMSWIGRFLVGHEARLYSLVHDLPGIPQFLGRVGRTGFVHAYVEGRPLQRDDRLPDEFFPNLRELISQVHARDIAYVDLEKRENILVTPDGTPCLIDFQISWHWPASWGGKLWPARAILRLLQASDRYHLIKHWRKLRPDQLGADALAAERPPSWIRLHRLLFRPLTRARRWILERLGARRKPESVPHSPL